MRLISRALLACALVAWCLSLQQVGSGTEAAAAGGSAAAATTSHMCAAHPLHLVSMKAAPLLHPACIMCRQTPPPLAPPARRPCRPPLPGAQPADGRSLCGLPPPPRRSECGRSQPDQQQRPARATLGPCCRRLLDGRRGLQARLTGHKCTTAPYLSECSSYSSFIAPYCAPCHLVGGDCKVNTAVKATW